MEEGPIHRSCLTHTLASAPRGSFHAPIYLEPAITLSRKDWHSYVNGAVLSPFRARVAPRDPAPPAAWPRWGCGGGGKRRRTNPTEDPDVETHRYATHHSVRCFAARRSRSRTVGEHQRRSRPKGRRQAHPCGPP